MAANGQTTDFSRTLSSQNSGHAVSWSESVDPGVPESGNLVDYARGITLCCSVHSSIEWR